MSTLMRVVLAQVPLDRAGIGGGVLATTQQVSLALGVATLGSLFLAIADTDPRRALVTVLAVQSVLAVVVAVTSLRLGSRAGATRTEV